MYKRAWWEGVERMASLEIELEKLIISDSPEAASLRLANNSASGRRRIRKTWGSCRLSATGSARRSSS